MNKLLARFREPSTWGGVAVLLGLVGFSHEQGAAITDLLAAVAAVASVFMPEDGAPR